MRHRCTINSVQYISTLKKLKEHLQRVHPTRALVDVLLLHDKQDHTSVITPLKRLWKLDGKSYLIPHLAPFDFHLLAPLKKNDCGIHPEDEEIHASLWFKKQSGQKLWKRMELIWKSDKLFAKGILYHMLIFYDWCLFIHKVFLLLLLSCEGLLVIRWIVWSQLCVFILLYWKMRRKVFSFAESIEFWSHDVLFPKKSFFPYYTISKKCNGKKNMLSKAFTSSEL